MNVELADRGLFKLPQQGSEEDSKQLSEGNVVAGEVPLPNMVTSTRLNIGEIKMNLDRYDNLGPICDITTHSITQGAMRLLRRRSNGKLYAGKFIPRPQVALMRCAELTGCCIFASFKRPDTSLQGAVGMHICPLKQMQVCFTSLRL